MLRTGRASISRITWVVVVVGVLLTATLTAAAQSAREDNEDRLMRQRVKEASAVLAASVPSIEVSLQHAATVADAFADRGDDAVRRALIRHIGVEKRFSSLTVSHGGGEPLRVGEAPKGTGPGSDPTSPSVPDDEFRVVGLLEGPDPRLGYTYTTLVPDPVVVYAEQTLPADRVTEIPPDSAFANLDYAVYLGDEESPDTLLFAGTDDLPLRGRRVVESVPFGDTTLRLAMATTDNLGGRLLATLPWMVVTGGLLATASGALLVDRLQRRRRDAEDLTDEIERLYDRERQIAHTLQQSILPARLPEVDGVEVAARYEAGAVGTEVGGDWYDVVELPGRVVVVVGDVAGRGVAAAAVMAGMRYSTHTLAAQGAEPEEVLTTINGLDGIRGDFVTMLCGSVDIERSMLTFSSAGHLPPLIVAGTDTRFLEASGEPPIGFLPSTQYSSMSSPLPAGSIMLLYTDGLCERRGESIDVGLERLRETASRFEGSLGSLLDHLYDELVGDSTGDDVAMLAIRIRP